MTTHLHAHVSTASSDCDGPMYDEWVTSLNDDEVAHHVKQDGVNDFHDLIFKARVLDSAVSYSPLDKATVTITEDGFSYSEPTDEGYRSAEVTWCEDEECDPNATSHRDVYAEMMGY